MLVAGEAGVGKTVLLRRFCEAQAARVLWGDCDALFTRSPLGPLTDVAAETGGELADLVETGAAPHAVAAALLRELTRRDPGDRRARGRALGRRGDAGRAAPGRPARRLRPSAGDRELSRRRARPRASAAGHARRALARRVDRPAARGAALGRGGRRARGAARRRRRAALSPHGRERVLRDRGAGRGRRRAARDRPRRRARPRRAPQAPARRVLDAAAIVSGAVDLPLLEALAGDAVEHLEDCLSCGVLGPAGTGVAFRHELARVAIEEALAPHRRRELHRRALHALAGGARREEGADPPASPTTPRAPGTRRPCCASRPRRPSARPSGARTCWRPTSTRAPCASPTPLPLGRTRRPARAALARVLPRRRSAEAIEALRAALECRRQLGDRRAEGDVLRALSSLLWCPGAVDEAERAGHEAVALLEPLGATRELAMAYANLATMAMNDEDARGVAEWGARALALARELGDAAIEVHVLNSIGTMEFLTKARTPAPRRSAASSSRSSTGSPTMRYAAYANLAWAAMRHRELAARRALPGAATAYASDPEFDLWWSPAGPPRPLRARPGALGGGVRDRGARDPRTARLTTAGRPRTDGEGSAARSPRRPGPVVTARRGARPGRAGAPALEPVAVARTETAWLAGDHARVAARARTCSRSPGAARPVGDGRARAVAPPRRRGRDRRRGHRRAVRARARRRVRGGRRVLDRPRLPL